MSRAVPGQVRIIGGRWRGSKLPVADAAGLRPTSDRVRETVFNWLQPVIHGARCLDLFAGSGALGFEAGSRGAAEVVLVERDPRLAAALRSAAARLHGAAVRIVEADAVRWLGQGDAAAFDIVFVDPPFAAGLWQPVLAGLPRLLAADAWIYVEAPHDAAFDVPVDWQLHRQGRTREVRYALFRAMAGIGNGE